MREFVSLDDVQDAVLTCTQEDIDQANAHVVRIAARCGILSPQILSPTPSIVKRLGVVFACYVRCLSIVGTDATVTIDGARSEDIYNIKRKTYFEELKRLEESINIMDFTGELTGGGSGAINLFRA